MRGVDEGFGLVVSESRDSACGDAGELGGGGFTSLRESLVVRASLQKEKYCLGGGWWKHNSFQLLIALK